MSTRNLGQLFKPESVAVIGATNREGSVGAFVMRNLLQGGFSGPIMPVNPKRRSVAGVLAYDSVDNLPIVPDMAVVCTPPATVPDIVTKLAGRGVPAATIFTAGLESMPMPDGRTAAQVVYETAKASGMRILGHNCLGLLVPGIGLNASFAHLPASKGNIAFVSQSGAMCTAVLDWAAMRDIGFSHFISMGNSLDVDFGDVIDYLGSDPGTKAILLYVESIKHRRNFMSAARAAARNKPILVVKSGRGIEGAAAANTHTGALAGADDVYDAAIRRAGMLRVDSIDDLFGAVETLARSAKLSGNRLAILTNGGGIGVMAVDALVEKGGKLAKLSDDTIAALDPHLPSTWSRANPVDIIGDAPGTRYAEAARVLLAAKEVDAVLVMHAPTATADSVEAARAIVEIAKTSKKPLLTSWVGGKAIAPALTVFSEAGIPTFSTPGQAVAAFQQLVEYRANQQTLMETPPSVPLEFTPATTTARLVVEGVLAGGETMANEAEAKAVLAAYGIPTVETHVASGPAEAAVKAREIGFPVALKILSPDIVHKSDMGGVALFLKSPDTVKSAAEEMLRNAERFHKGATIQGFSVQSMARRPGAHELIIGVKNDPVFGPVILFGRGGTAVEVFRDRAVGLPPLNMRLARDIVDRTQIAKLLKGYRNRPPADIDAVCLVLTQVAQMVVDIPEIEELDINPLFADQDGVLAVDARIRLRNSTDAPGDRLAIHPYPKKLEETFRMKDGRQVLLRPIRPEDEPEHYDFLSKLTPEDIRFRFFGLVGELPHDQMARLTQIDYAREMAFIASAPLEDGGRETLGVVRGMADPNNDRVEFAIVIRSDIKGQGLGRKLMDKLISYYKSRNASVIIGQVLSDNQNMMKLMTAMKFTAKRMPGENIMEVEFPLDQ
ncbi:MAG: bifunctional acetate--CoA ligase family protein/GNAT family N-acetyltransferase [Magnetospiraceae bacterium]